MLLLRVAPSIRLKEGGYPRQRLLNPPPRVKMLVGDMNDLLCLVLMTTFSDHILEAQTVAKALHKGGYKTTA
jgi:hypothetical protein